MRLIDADLIDMEDMDFHTGQTRAMACEAAQDIVDAQPAVDAEPVIRCRDCKHSLCVKSAGKYECRRMSGPLRHGDDFCSRGERKGGENNG